MVRAIGLLALAFCLWLPVPALGQAAIDAGSTVAGALPASAVRLAVIASLAPEHPLEPASWSVSVGSLSVSVDAPDLRHAQEQYASQATVTVRCGGQTVAERKVDRGGGSAYATIKIISEGGESARVLAGYGAQQEVAAGLPLRIEGGQQAVVSCSRPMLCRRLSVLSLDSEVPAVCPVSDIEQRLAASSDVCEARWAYLDRDIDADAATLGGKYDLATVKRPDGGYWIVYLGGGQDGGRWQPMMVKGVLRPTIFAGHFDMEWIDARGVRLRDDNTAQVSADGALLTLRFPLYGAQLRFSRR